MSVSLLATKVNMPPSGKYLVERPRLMARLQEGLHPGCRLTLVSAPAGFGKTTLIAAWLRSASAADAPSETDAANPALATAWLSLDEGENDPVIFWTYLIAALRTQYPEIGQQTLNLLTAPPAEMEGKLAALLNDLSLLPRPGVLVLDDYHLIRNPLIHQSLGFFIEHLPPQFHLVIVSRTDPPLPLALLRGRGQLLELRLNDLRFSDMDADAYLNTGLGLDLAAQSVQVLNQKTEGWIVGLQMAALSLRESAGDNRPGVDHRDRMADFVTTFSGSNRYILDYLIEEVLNRQPETVQNFLLRTSILDRLCAPLCDALLQGGEANPALDSQPVLEMLESRNLFIQPLDNQRYWYRYHALFADLLKKRLAASERTPGLLAELHRRALDWYEQNGLIPNAIEHAFALKDFPKAAVLVSQIAEGMWGRGEHATLLAWMDALPEKEVQQYPQLWVFRVSMLISAGRLQEAEASIPAIERYIKATLAANPEQNPLIGKVYTLRTYIASFYSDYPAVFEHARLALEHMPGEADAGQRCGVSLVLGNAYRMTGNLAAADRALSEGIADGKKGHKPYMVLTGMANLVTVLLLQGNLKRAAQVCQEGLQLVQQTGMNRSPMTADLWIGWGAILYERGALAEAAQYVHQGLELAREQSYIWQMAWGSQVQARLLLAQGDVAGAVAAAQAGEHLAENHNVPEYFTCGTVGLQALLWMHHGTHLHALKYLRAHEIQARNEIRFPHLPEYLALVRVCWSRRDLEGAMQLLEKAQQWSEANQQMGGLLSALLLRAMLEQERGHLPQSTQALRQALALAEPEGYFQSFIDEGEPMAALLTEALRQGISPDYVGRLLEGFPRAVPASPAGATPAVGANPQEASSAPSAGLVEPLSKRELETLQLIAEGYSNKEIAQKMYISLRTVKYYSTGIYGKLGVDSRMQAVIRARELGLLD